MLDDMLPRLTDVKYLTLIDISSGHNIKLHKKSSCLMTFSCPLGRYQCIRPPLGAASVGNMFQKKIDKVFDDIPNVFGISDDILIAGFGADCRDHDERLEQVLCRCRKVTALST